MKKLMILSVLLVTSALPGFAQSADADQDSSSVDELTPYEQLFEDADRILNAEGLIDLHLIDEKLFFEFPKELLGREMIIGTSVMETSNINDAAAMERPDTPLLIMFTERDSTIYMHRGNHFSRADNGEGNIARAIDKNNLPPVLFSFEIEAESPDEDAYVFDATQIFVSGREELSPFGPNTGVPSMFSGFSSNFKPNLSQLLDVNAFEDNVSITSYLSYGISSTFLGFVVENDRPATFRVKHSIMVLPDEKMRPRLADERIGVYSNEYLVYSEADNGVRRERYAHRWNLPLADADEYAWRNSTQVAEPITFYVDPNFPDEWIPYIMDGINAWSRAFEEIGLQNTIKAKLFPDDEQFSPHNTSVSTVNFVLSGRDNTVGQRWTDPRTGEILSASVNIYSGMIDKIREDLFFRTSAVNPDARTVEPSNELIGQTLKNMTTHLIGNSLGLTRNLGASSAMPVDSLRSPSFTQRYGITPSIMDHAFYNTVAQPGDMERGVQMTPNDLGVYDYYAIDWLYKPFIDVDSYRDEVDRLTKKIEEKQHDPMYRFRQQQVVNIFDPDIVANDLGDDQVKATRYAMQNLEYTYRNMNEWLADEDPDYLYRTHLHFSFVNIHFFWYLRQPLNLLGGVRQYQTFEGAPFAAYEVVPAEEQRRAVLYLLELLEDLDWMNDESVKRNIDSLSGDPGEYMRSVLMSYILDWGVQRTEFTQTKTRSNPYTQQMFLDDVYSYLWEDIDPSEIDDARLSLQTLFTRYLMARSPIKAAGNREAGGSSALQASGHPAGMAALGQPAQVDRTLQRLAMDQNSLQALSEQTESLFREQSGQNSGGEGSYLDLTVYEMLYRTQADLDRLSREAEEDSYRYEYEYLLWQVNQLLGSTN